MDERQSLDGSTGISLLRAIVQLLAERQDGGGTAGQNFIAAVTAYEHGAASGAQLDACLGLLPAPGHAAWWTIETRKKRAALIVELDKSMFSGERPRQHPRALKIAQRLRRYQADIWPRERGLPVPPADPVRRLMWGVLRLGDAPAWRTVERRLAEAGATLPNAVPIPGKAGKRQSPNVDGDEENTRGSRAGNPANRGGCPL